jgi:sec-independent protein translocase protein TatB
MLGLNFSELMVIVIVLIVVVGPERLTPMLRTAGRYYGQIKRMSDEFRRALMLEVDREEAEERAAQFKKRREEAKRIADEARAPRRSSWRRSRPAVPPGGCTGKGKGLVTRPGSRDRLPAGGRRSGRGVLHAAHAHLIEQAPTHRYASSPSGWHHVLLRRTDLDFCPSHERSAVKHTVDPARSARGFTNQLRVAGLRARLLASRS